MNKSLLQRIYFSLLVIYISLNSRRKSQSDNPEKVCLETKDLPMMTMTLKNRQCQKDQTRT